MKHVGTIYAAAYSLLWKEPDFTMANRTVESFARQTHQSDVIPLSLLAFTLVEFSENAHGA